MGDAAARRGPGLNLGFYAALTPFRHYVLGEESMERAATPAETSQIATLLREAMDAGAFGFTTTNAAQHIGYQGRPLACRNASPAELTAYANVLRDLGRGTIEVSLTNEVSVVDDAEYALMDLLLRESGRPVTWLALLNRVDNPEAPLRTLDRLDVRRRGAVESGACDHRFKLRCLGEHSDAFHQIAVGMAVARHRLADGGNGGESRS